MTAFGMCVLAFIGGFAAGAVVMTWIALKIIEGDWP